MTIGITAYRPQDAALTRDLFQAAIRGTASRDYTPEQVVVWSRVDDLGLWNDNRMKAHCLIARIDGVPAGFTEIDDEAYLNMMFVDPRFAGRGVATALLQVALGLVDPTATVTARASLTARPFFEARGFRVDAEHHPVIRGVRLTNFSVSLAPRGR
ncbi:GNAT family N-acetyltransferase [Tessaracoccus palaemonis]|uniref:GNAT family N-acetyltransferase n=1 Tax=Tessaracoccus palaemonis TaxID=2829499 RepID=A0ABX8SLJ7_9ACTN|nr:GNAT family N-acetyltransferase [Tessaracoccus palaemonis]QXT63520.1 GNAT family N-acetyltransferase [Tessaracoccus palaemonis]